MKYIVLSAVLFAFSASAEELAPLPYEKYADQVLKGAAAKQAASTLRTPHAEKDQQEAQAPAEEDVSFDQKASEEEVAQKPSSPVPSTEIEKNVHSEKEPIKTPEKSAASKEAPPTFKPEKPAAPATAQKKEGLPKARKGSSTKIISAGGISTIRDLTASCEATTAEEMKICADYLAKAIENIRAAEEKRGSRYICNSSELSSTEVRNHYLDWQKKNPKFAKEDATRGVLTALMKIYPCPKDQPTTGPHPS